MILINPSYPLKYINALLCLSLTFNPLLSHAKTNSSFGRHFGSDDTVVLEVKELQGLYQQRADLQIELSQVRFEQQVPAGLEKFMATTKEEISAAEAKLETGQHSPQDIGRLRIQITELKKNLKNTKMLRAEMAVNPQYLKQEEERLVTRLADIEKKILATETFVQQKYYALFSSADILVKKAQVMAIEKKLTGLNNQLHEAQLRLIDNSKTIGAIVLHCFFIMSLVTGTNLLQTKFGIKSKNVFFGSSKYAVSVILLIPLVMAAYTMISYLGNDVILKARMAPLLDQLREENERLNQLIQGQLLLMQH